MAPSNFPMVVDDVGPEEGPEGVAPLGRLAEQLVEAHLFLGRVAAALWLDADLAAQRQGVDAEPVGLLDPQRAA